MSRWVCKLCIIQKGLKGSDLDRWPEAPDDAWIAEHLRTAHGIEVREATDEEQQVSLTGAVGDWIPFEERERPNEDLMQAKLTLRLAWRSIEITGADEAATGRLFAWLQGQIILAHAAVNPATRKDWGFD